MAGTGSAYHDEESGAGMIVDINITPMVDITLVLLIIFMVTARVIAARGIEVEKPKTVAGSDNKSPLELTLDARRVLYLGDEPVTDRAALSEHIRKLVAKDDDLQAIITADVVVPHGEVMSVIDLVKLAGVKRLALTSEPPEAPPE